MYLGNVTVNNTMSVINNEVLQFFIRNVLEGAILVRKPDAFIGAHLMKHL